MASGRARTTSSKPRTVAATARSSIRTSWSSLTRRSSLSSRASRRLLRRGRSGRPTSASTAGSSPRSTSTGPSSPRTAVAQAVQRGAVDAEQVGRLLHPPPGAHPELPAAGIGEEGGAWSGRSAAPGTGSASWPSAAGAEQEDAARLRVPGQPVVVAAGPEAVLGRRSPAPSGPRSGSAGGRRGRGRRGRAPPLRVAGRPPDGGAPGRCCSAPSPGTSARSARPGSAGRGSGEPSPAGARPRLCGHPVSRIRGRWFAPSAGGPGLCPWPRMPMFHPRRVPGAALAGWMGAAATGNGSSAFEPQAADAAIPSALPGQTSPRQ